jgi:ParB family transcriptional regulator, chromosome partitioning protein
MINRKEMLKAAFGKDSSVSAQTPYPAPPANGSRVPSGAVRAMGLSLGRIGEDAARAEALAQQLARGELLHELDPQVVEPSFVDDRIDRTADPEFRRLVDSINHSGQQVPILVRPHPQSPGRYQVAYGHRRLSACMELGRPVKALVRGLSDAELVVAQGKENAERRNLSFIERAMFAAHLDQQGFDRATIQAALAVHPAEMTRLLSVARGVPAEFVAAIGPAPRAGRPRWMELAALIAHPDSAALLRNLIAQPSFRRVGSDTRFDLVMDRLRAPQLQTASPIIIRDRKGRPIIKADHGTAGFRLLVDLKLAPGLDQFLLEKLPEILADFPSE